ARCARLENVLRRVVDVDEKALSEYRAMGLGEPSDETKAIMEMCRAALSDTPQQEIPRLSYDKNRDPQEMCEILAARCAELEANIRQRNSEEFDVEQMRERAALIVEKHLPVIPLKAIADHIRALPIDAAQEGE
ncbi:MAG: hypothetical protein ACR2QF_09360, partial [Geminicoccaceae bacterium]